MKFTYKISTQQGIQTGELIADSKGEAITKLTANGSQVLSIVQVKASNDLHIPFLDSIIHRIKLSDKVLFAKNLEGMIRAGVPLYRGLAVLERQTKNPRLQTIIHAMMEDINAGFALSDSLKKYESVFGSLFVAMVKAGEESGNLSGTLKEISFNLEKVYKLRKKVKGAMTYPMVIIGAIAIVGVLMFIYVVPSLVSLFRDMNSELPKTTQIVIWISDTIQSHALLLLLGVGVVIAGVIYVIRLPQVGKYIDKIILRLPVIKTIVVEMNAARTARTLSSLLSSSVPMVRSLEITESVLQNHEFKKVLEIAKKDVTKGITFSRTLADHGQVFPPMFQEMVEVGEETGNLSQMLVDVAVFYEEEVDQKTKDLSTIVEPILMIFIGAAVGFFAISMITPMYSVLGNF